MVNVSTEHLENHTAKLTVEIEPERIEKAVRKTARQISQKARIPGFRPGKAPFNVVINMFGYEYVLNEALKDIVDDIYQEALAASDVEPYAPGSLEDIGEQGQQLVFTVPKRPEVELGDYRAVRLDFQEPEITDDMVNDAMETLLEGEAVIEDVDRPAKMEDQVEIGHLYVGLLLNEEEIAELEADDDEADDDDAEADGTYEIVATTDPAAAAAANADAGDENGDEGEEEPERPIFHQHDLTRVLRDDDKDLLPGFSAELVEAQAGDDIEFYLDIPADFEDPQLAGRRVRVEVGIAKVQSRTLPEWSDDLATRISNNEFETMLELRIDVRKQLETRANALADRELASEALDKVIKDATFRYPPVLVDVYVDALIKDLEDNVLSKQGFNLEHYLKLVERSEEDFRESLQPKAIEHAQSDLVMTRLIKVEELDATDDDVDAEIERMVEQMGGKAATSQFRSFFNTENARRNIANELETRRVFERLAAIAKGEEPAVGVVREALAAEDTAEKVDEVDAAESGENITDDVADSMANVADAGGNATAPDPEKQE